MSERGKKPEIVFSPGCFDNFEGTQEELAELISEITAMFESGEMSENAVQVDMEALMEEDPDAADAIFKSLNSDNSPRNLH